MVDDTDTEYTHIVVSDNTHDDNDLYDTESTSSDNDELNSSYSEHEYNYFDKYLENDIDVYGVAIPESSWEDYGRTRHFVLENDDDDE